MAQKYERFINRVKEAVYNQPIPPHYNPDEWKKKNFNCYAYAMRVCMDFYDDNALEIIPRPGFITSGFINYKVTKERVLMYFKEDCETLGLQVLPTDLEEKIGPNEYKIAVYVKPGRDFHFARQDSDGKWSEKNGWFQKIKVLDEKM